MGKIILGCDYRIKKNILNSDRVVRDKLSQELMKSYTTLKKVGDLVAYKDGRREVVEHIRDTLNTLYLFNPSSIYLAWLFASSIISFLIFEYSKFKAVRCV